MTTEYIDLLLNKIRQAQANHSPPKVRYDKNDKRIAVTYDFSYIPKVKIIASGEQWLKFFYESDLITFETLRPYLSRPPKKVLHDLKQYAEKCPYDFSEDIFVCINYANSRNPIYPPNTKARGGSAYGLTWHEMNEIKATARQLYVYLRHNYKPADLEQLLKEKYGVSDKDIKSFYFNKAAAVTMLTIEKVFDFKIDSRKNDIADLTTIFYRRFIATPGMSLRRISKSKRIMAGDSPFLKKVLPLL